MTHNYDHLGNDNYRALARVFYEALHDTSTTQEVFLWLNIVQATSRLLGHDYTVPFSHEVFWRECGVHEAVGEAQAYYMLNGYTPTDAGVMA